MAIKLVSDVHGAHQALSPQLSSRDTLIMLGDYANLIDFDTLDGIVADIISKERLIRVLMQVASGDSREAEELVIDFTNEGGKYYSRVIDLLREGYRALFDAIPCDVYLLYGNNDYPDVLEECTGEKAQLVGGAVEIKGLSFGFVSGAPPHRVSLGLPGDMDEVSFVSQIDGLGQADILCSHVPPAAMGLEYDMIADREEASSDALTAYIHERQPSYAFHGHVHNPQKDTASLGKTHIRNLGHFRRHQTVFTLNHCDKS